MIVFLRKELRDEVDEALDKVSYSDEDAVNVLLEAAADESAFSVWDEAKFLAAAQEAFVSIAARGDTKAKTCKGDRGCCRRVTYDPRKKG